jgi:hypothetical protein
MNATSSKTLGDHLQGEVPSPVLFNSWKHHAGALRQRLEEIAEAGPAALPELADRLVVMGSELMDLYTGTLTPVAIAERVLVLLRAENRLAVEAYRAWLQESGGYGVLTFAEDGSRWVLRLGDENDRYLHVHPARWAPQTRRVRANVLKTAVMVLAHVAIHGGDPLDVALVNAIRRQYLGLSPMREVVGEQGLSVVIELLRSAPL